MSARLKTGLWIRALIRRHDGESMVLHKGDEDAGAVLIQLIDRARNTTLLRETIDTDGTTLWERIPTPTQQDADTYIERQRRYDPDLWVIELEIPDVTTPIEHTLGGRSAPD